MVSTAAFHARVRGSVPGLGGLKETKLFLPHPRVKVSIVGSLRDREVACSASDRQGSNFESCVWRTVSSQSSHHPQEVLLAQFSLYVHKGGLKPDSFHFISFSNEPFVAFRGMRYVCADCHPNHCRILRGHFHIITYHGQTVYTNTFAVYLTYALTYQPYTVARMNFTICMQAFRTLRSKLPYNSKMSCIGRYVRYKITRYHANYITYHSVPPAQNCSGP